MRQKDDQKFANLLNRLRVNTLTQSDRDELNKCKVTADMQTYQLNAPHLFAENYFMHIFNDAVIDRMNTEKVAIPCHDIVLSPKLSMVNTEDGLANGASCTVKQIEYKQSGTNRPSIIWVQFDDEKAGKETQSKCENRSFYHSNINKGWTPIFDIERTFLYNRKTFQRIQFSLQPSAGRSVHRVQGRTLDSVVIDLSQRRRHKIPHLHYVALSGVRSMKNLQILNFNDQALKLDDQVEREIKRLQEKAPVKLYYNLFYNVDANFHVKIAFNNCRSLHLHLEDIKDDRNLTSSHVFG